MPTHTLTLTTAQYETLLKALGDAHDERSSQADSFTTPDGKPIKGYERKYRRARKLCDDYAALAVALAKQHLAAMAQRRG